LISSTNGQMIRKQIKPGTPQEAGQRPEKPENQFAEAIYDR